VNEQLAEQQQLHEDQDTGGINRPSFNAENPNYLNADVQNIREQLGDFDFGEEQSRLGRREYK
jgi:hypothetical protein